MKNVTRIFITILLILAFLQAGYAEIFSGTRSTAAGTLVADDAWSTSGVVVTFTVEQKSDGWHYVYTFKNNSGQNLTGSQFLKLETSNVSGSSYYLVTSTGSMSLSAITTDPGFHLWDAPASDPSYFAYDPHLKIGGNRTEAQQDPIVAAQVRELSDGSIEIISSQAPMWGDFYLRGPSGSAAGPPEVLNRGFEEGVFPRPSGGMYGSVGSAPAFDPTVAMTDSSVRYWILVPDTRRDLTETPVPAAFWLLGSGLLGLIGFRKFRK